MLHIQLNTIGGHFACTLPKRNLNHLNIFLVSRLQTHQVIFERQYRVGACAFSSFSYHTSHTALVHYNSYNFSWDQVECFVFSCYNRPAVMVCISAIIPRQLFCSNDIFTHCSLSTESVCLSQSKWTRVYLRPQHVSTAALWQDMQRYEEEGRCTRCVSY